MPFALYWASKWSINRIRETFTESNKTGEWDPDRRGAIRNPKWQLIKDEHCNLGLGVKAEYKGRGSRILSKELTKDEDGQTKHAMTFRYTEPKLYSRFKVNQSFVTPLQYPTPDQENVNLKINTVGVISKIGDGHVRAQVEDCTSTPSLPGDNNTKEVRISIEDLQNVDLDEVHEMARTDKQARKDLRIWHTATLGLDWWIAVLNSCPYTGVFAAMMTDFTQLYNRVFYNGWKLITGDYDGLLAPQPGQQFDDFYNETVNPLLMEDLFRGFYFETFFESIPQVMLQTYMYYNRRQLCAQASITSSDYKCSDNKGAKDNFNLSETSMILSIVFATISMLYTIFFLRYLYWQDWFLLDSSSYLVALLGNDLDDSRANGYYTFDWLQLPPKTMDGKRQKGRRFPERFTKPTANSIKMKNKVTMFKHVAKLLDNHEKIGMPLTGDEIEALKTGSRRMMDGLYKIDDEKGRITGTHVNDPETGLVSHVDFTPINSPDHSEKITVKEAAAHMMRAMNRDVLGKSLIDKIRRTNMDGLRIEWNSERWNPKFCNDEHYGFGYGPKGYDTFVQVKSHKSSQCLYEALACRGHGDSVKLTRLEVTNTAVSELTIRTWYEWLKPERSHGYELVIPANSISPNEARVLADTLIHAGLHVLKISENDIREHGLHAIGERLSNCTHLTHLDVSNNKYDAEMQSQFGGGGLDPAAGLSAGPNYGTTRTNSAADFYGGDSSDDSDLRMGSQEWNTEWNFPKQLAKCVLLVDLRLQGLSMNGEDLHKFSEVLSKWRLLKVLDISKTKLAEETDEKWLDELFENLTKLQRLQELYIRDNDISAQELHSLTARLKGFNTLRVLDLDHNRIGDVGCDLLFQALDGQCSELRDIHISHNQINPLKTNPPLVTHLLGTGGALAGARTVRKGTHRFYLNGGVANVVERAVPRYTGRWRKIRDEAGVQQYGGGAFVEAWEDAELHELDFKDIVLENDGCLVLQQIVESGCVPECSLLHFSDNGIQDKGLVALTEVVRGCKKLTDLTFSQLEVYTSKETGNKKNRTLFQEKSLVALMKVIQNSKITELNLSGTRLGSESCNVLANAIKGASSTLQVVNLDECISDNAGIRILADAVNQQQIKSERRSSQKTLQTLQLKGFDSDSPVSEGHPQRLRRIVMSKPKKVSIDVWLELRKTCEKNGCDLEATNVREQDHIIDA